MRAGDSPWRKGVRLIFARTRSFDFADSVARKIARPLYATDLAADIKIPGMTPQQMYAAARNVPAFRNGGIGVALHQGYIHVDVRSTLARWCYDANGKACAWDASLDV